jgi:hypothetical protein
VTKQKRYWDEERLIAAIQRWHKEHGRTPTCREWHPSRAKAAGRPYEAEEWVMAGPGVWPSFQTVVAMFGTWNKGMEAAGFPARGRGESAVRMAGAYRGLRGRTLMENLYSSD